MRRRPCGGGRSRLACPERSRRVEHSSTAFASRRSQRGYILLTLMLAVAIVSIAAATAASSLAFKIRRDREEELIHRGAEYSRAIRRYTKKMGRYPLRIEDLENTDGLRFLRKRYKDPMTGKDFKLLHMDDLQRIGVGGLSAAATAPPRPAGSSTTNAVQDQTTSGPAPDQNAAAAADADASTASNSVTSDSTTSNAPSKAPGSPTASNDSSQPLSGGVIVGVASASHRETIREFNRKNHYNDWLFFYDPAYDRGFPINGPTQLTLPATNPALQPMAPAQSARQ